MVLAQEESRLLARDHLGTEHLLLGLVREDQGIAARALAALGVSYEKVKVAVVEAHGLGSGSPSGHVPFTPRAKRALEAALGEALSLGHNYIGTEHLLLGLLRKGQDQGVAMEVLDGLDLDPIQVRGKVMELLAGYQSSSAEAPPGTAQPSCPGCRTGLEGRMGAKALAATGHDGSVIALEVIYCLACGRALGMFPSS